MKGKGSTNIKQTSILLLYRFEYCWNRSFPPYQPPATGFPYRTQPTDCLLGHIRIKFELTGGHTFVAPVNSICVQHLQKQLLVT